MTHEWNESSRKLTSVLSRYLIFVSSSSDSAVTLKVTTMSSDSSLLPVFSLSCTKYSVQGFVMLGALLSTTSVESDLSRDHENHEGRILVSRVNCWLESTAYIDTFLKANTHMYAYIFLQAQTHSHTHIYRHIYIYIYMHTYINL